MYYVRIVFLVTQGTELDITEDQCLLQTDSAAYTIKIDRRFNKEKVIISSSGFNTEEEAFREGKKLVYNIKKTFVKKGIPINISGGLGVLDTTQTSIYVGGATEFGLENIHLLLPGLENKTVRNEVLGMEVYQLDEDISEVTFLIQEVDIKRTVAFPGLRLDDLKENDKLEIAYSLLNSSNAINDLRTNFILKISSIEALVSEVDYRDENYCNAVKQINKLITKNNIKLDLSDMDLEKVVNGLKSSIGALKKKTIGEKCKALIENCNIQKQYQGKDVVSFFNECYNMRSDFVHTGTFKNKEDEAQKIRELEMYLFDLNSLVLDILESYEKSL